MLNLHRMNMNVTRYGYVSAAGNGKLTVRLRSEGDNCDACSLGAVCGKTDVKVVPYPDASADMTGRKVKITMRAQVLPSWAELTMPVAILISVAVVLVLAGLPDVWCVGASAAALGLWYIVVNYINKVRQRAPKVEFVEHFPSRGCYNGDIKQRD